jgi:hypothetical protein
LDNSAISIWGDSDPAAKLDFLKERIGIEVAFGHASFIGIDILKFQISSYSSLDRIDLGVYIVTAKNFQRIITSSLITIGRDR